MDLVSLLVSQEIAVAGVNKLTKRNIDILDP
jgi:hypothetical protein